MTIETDILTSLNQPNLHQQPMSSPFTFAQSLPNQYMSSPHANSIDMNQHQSSHNHTFPSSLFNGYKFGQGQDNPEPPLNFSIMPSAQYDQRSRSLSTSRAPVVGKAPSSRTRQPRKLSMNDGRPPTTGQTARGRSSAVHPRTMSHNDVHPGRMGLGIGLDTHKEGEQTDSVTPPDFQPNASYGVPIPRGIEPSSWTSHGSAPSLIRGSYGSYAGLHDEAILDR